jgi:hypothetical protein
LSVETINEKNKKEYFQTYYQENKHRRNNVGAKQTRQVYHERLTALVSGSELRCEWCGFSNIHALQIDHRQGGGASAHKNQFKDRASFYKYYLDRPELAKKELHLLCANCNVIKRHQLYKSPVKIGGRKSHE